MLPNTLTELNLFGQRRAGAARPSYHPAVEALEERVVLNGGPPDFFGLGTGIGKVIDGALAGLHQTSHQTPSSGKSRSSVLAARLENQAQDLYFQVLNGQMDAREALNQMTKLQAQFAKLKKAPDAKTVQIRVLYQDFTNWKDAITRAAYPSPTPTPAGH